MKPYDEADEHMTDDEAPEEHGQYFTAEEIADYLGCTVEEFYSRAGHGDLLPVEIEEEHLYRQEDVKRFLVNIGYIEGESQW